jgi:hypothetical protein
MMSEIEGYLERASLHEVVGWVWNPEFPWARQAVEITAAGADPLVAIADGFRGDVKAAGKGDGCYGFAVQFKCDPEALVSVRVVNGAELTSSPMPASLIRALELDPDSHANRLLSQAIQNIKAKLEYGAEREI